MPGLETHQSMSLPEKNYLNYYLKIIQKFGVSMYYFIYYFHSVFCIISYTNVYDFFFFFLILYIPHCLSVTQIPCSSNKMSCECMQTCVFGLCALSVRSESGPLLRSPHSSKCVSGRGDQAEGLRSQEETHKAQQVKTLLSGPAERLTWIQSISVRTHLVFKRTKHGERPMACISRMLAKHD